MRSVAPQEQANRTRDYNVLRSRERVDTQSHRGGKSLDSRYLVTCQERLGPFRRMDGPNIGLAYVTPLQTASPSSRRARDRSPEEGIGLGRLDSADANHGRARLPAPRTSRAGGRRHDNQHGPYGDARARVPHYRDGSLRISTVSHRPLNARAFTGRPNNL